MSNALNTSSHFDAIIVGAGPAGIAFAKTYHRLSPQAKILLIEQRKFPRDKVCGDGLTFAAIPLIHEIFPELKSQFPSHNTQKAYTIIYPNGKMARRDNLELDIIPREDFDEKLFRALGSLSIDILENAKVTDIILNEKKVSGVTCNKDGKETTIYGKFIIGADGSQGLLRRKTGSLDQDDSPTIVRQYVKGLPASEDGFVFFLDTKSSGYFWIFPFMKGGERWANIGYGGRRVNPRDQFTKLSSSPLIKKYLGDAQPQGPIKGFPLNLANTSIFGGIKFTRPLWGEGYALLGDAACLAHPYTGEGISAALFSGKSAADVLSQNLPLPQSRRLYHQKIKGFIKETYQMRETFFIFKLPWILPPCLQPLFFDIASKLANQTKTKN